MRCVLIVDDNVWMQRIIAKILLSYGLKPVLATNGYEAVAHAVEYQPIAIILDIIMPELSGHQTLRLLKTIPSTKDIPVLMITVASDAENLGMAIKMGASGFIRKPFTRSTIFEKLTDVLGEEALFDADFHVMKHITDAEVDALPAFTPQHETAYNSSAEASFSVAQENARQYQVAMSAPMTESVMASLPEIPISIPLTTVAEKVQATSPQTQTANSANPPSRDHLAKTYGQERKPDIEAIRSILARSTPRS